MHFRTRAFLLTFIPIACLLGLSFLLVQGYVKHTVRLGLLNTLRQSQHQVAQLRDENNRDNSRLLRAFSHDEQLQAAVRSFRGLGAPPQLELDPTPDSLDTGLPQGPAVAGPSADSSTLPVADDMLPADGTLQDQLLRLGVKGGVDLIMMASPDGTPMAGAVRAGGDSAELVPLFVFPQISKGDLILFRGEPFQTGSVPVESHGVKVGSLILGQRLKLSNFATSTVLLHGSWVIESDIDKSRLPAIGAKLAQCDPHKECTLDLRGVEWLSMPVLDKAIGTDWSLYSLVDVDDAIKPVESALRRIFFSVLVISLITALFCSVAWSRAIVRPIAVMVSRLHDAAQTGKLPEFSATATGIREMRDLEQSFNNAAFSVRKAHSDLNDAYLQFVYSLANALDARDCYTAGHSKRVSDISCAIASAMGQGMEDIERLRMGALLHDIGKLGIPDAVLQYPGKLSNEDFNTIKTHPLIGRRILQGVQGFSVYLPAVELHHENWDGTGYPQRQQGNETPLDARIIHVADAYDAMTTDRAYRKGMTHDRAMQILAECAGTQFDPEVVATLFRIADAAKFARDPAEAASVLSKVSGTARIAEPVPITVRTRTHGTLPVVVTAEEKASSSDVRVA